MRQLTQTFTDAKTLKSAYMHFVRDGGLFFPTNETLHLGDTVTATITLPDASEPVTFTAEVIWIAPSGDHASQKSGVGIQFDAIESGNVNARIKALIAPLREQPTTSNTM